MKADLCTSILGNDSVDMIDKKKKNWYRELFIMSAAVLSWEFPPPQSFYFLFSKAWVKKYNLEIQSIIIDNKMTMFLCLLKINNINFFYQATHKLKA